jgi:aminoglycoside phosphotransferase (APT) family kinase protein
VTAKLPSGVPAPVLLGCYDEGDWIALVMQDIAGRQPVTPWVSGELAGALAALEALASAGTPAPPIVSERPAGALLGNEFGGWNTVAGDPPPDLDPWAAANLDRLIDLAARGVTAVRGDTLSHTDIRADNLLIDDAGRVTIVDWPWAMTASAWFDTLCLAMNVRLHGGDVADALLARSPLTASADPDDVTAVLAGLAGGFVDLARRPPPPGMPTVRAFQRRHAALLLDWVRNRL